MTIKNNNDIQNYKNIVLEASKGLENLAKRYSKDEFNGYGKFINNHVVSKDTDFFWKLLFSDQFKP